ncbi:hypothetical protein AB0D49_05440 [Streptomyces sp. NPDC048290]|uniref:hypothetical protein n=1 Tax=Streptomyces sp. NPDC048290 TaxID=3155811 RepID=UPI003432A2BF
MVASATPGVRLPTLGRDHTTAARAADRGGGEPEAATRALCAHLGVDREPSMLDYGSQDHGVFRPQLGDWSSTIRSGRVQTARPAAADI